VIRPKLALRACLLAAGLSVPAALLISQGLNLPAVPTDDPLLRAMHDELERSQQLRIVAGQDVPYFISYGLTDSESLRVSATLGSVVNTAHTRYRSPSIEVRVGSYDFDNTDHVFSGSYSGSGYDGDWPLDDSYQNFRDQLWLGTDRVFKTALESMARKRASLNSAAVTASEQLPDFSKTTPVVSIAKVSKVALDDKEWIARAARLSSVFTGYPDVLASGVELELIPGVTTLMNTEGTVVRYDDGVFWLNAKAEGQAPDGMVVHDAVSLQSLTLDKLASEAEMKRAVTAVADDVRDLAHAPRGDDFSGPTLMEPAAAAQFLAQLIGDNLRVPRRPLANPGQRINFTPSELESKIGSRVLPDIFDVKDDATQAAWNGKPLVGFYPFDLEGVAPKPVSVIEKGILKSFLTTRQPIKGFAESNGHARLPGSYGARSAAIGSLFVTARESMPLADLKTMLIGMIKDRGKPYGILIRKLDYPYSASTSELQALAQANAQSGGSARPVSPPLMVYRVYPDGREELVRGLRFHGVSTRTLRDILAASTETTLFDYINNAAPLALLGAGGYLAPTSVVAPGLLFDEIEFDTPQEQLPKLSVVPPPNVAAAQ
jgi:TldD protein